MPSKYQILTKNKEKPCLEMKGQKQKIDFKSLQTPQNSNNEQENQSKATVEQFMRAKLKDLEIKSDRIAI